MARNGDGISFGVAGDWWMHLLNLWFLVELVVFLTRRGQRTTHKTGLALGMNTLFQVSLFSLYCCTAVAHPFFQARSQSKKGVAAVAATVLIYYGKSVVSLAMHIFNSGWTSENLTQASGGRFGPLPAWLCLTVPAVLFATSDLLSFFCLDDDNIDPLTYRIVMLCRIFFSAAAWQLCFRRSCSGLQWFAMTGLVIAGITKTFDSSEPSNGYTGSKFILLFFQVVVSSAGSVCVEVLQKELPVPTDLQNCVISIQGLLFLLLYAMMSVREAFAPTVFLGNQWMVASILCMMAHGIITAYFLRELSVVLKEMAGIAVTVGSAFIQWAVLGSPPCTLVGFESVGIVVVALLVYNVDPIAARAAPKSDGPSHS